MKKIVFFFTGVAIMLLTTCTYDAYAPDICFQEDVLPIFISNCAMSGCHSAGEHKAGYDLTNYDGIMEGVKAKHPLFSEVYKVVKGNNPSMPAKPYPNLTRTQVNTIRQWIQAGARNTSNCTSCDSSNYTFSGRIRPLVQNWCVSCHNASVSGGGYDFSSYSGITVAIKVGSFLGSIQHAPGYSPMPQNGSSLSNCDINAIEKWIKVGYPDN
jgi:hypothetical protein